MRAARRAAAATEGAARAPEQIASVLLNAGADGGRAGSGAVLRQIRDAFASHGWACEITCIPAQRFAAEAPLRVRDARGVVVAAGGDGTLNIVANACRSHRRPLGLLPLGQANLAARMLGLDAGVEPAAAAIATGRPEEVRHAELNGRMFLTRAAFGLHPGLPAVRHAGIVAHGLRGRLSALASGLRTLARANAPFEAVLEASVDAGVAATGDRVRATAMQVALNVVPAGLEDHPSIAGCVARGELVLTGLARHARWPTLHALFGSASGTVEPPRAGVAACASRIVVHTRRMQVPVAMDGDLRMMEPPLEFRVRSSGLRMMCLPCGESAAALESDPMQDPAQALAILR